MVSLMYTSEEDDRRTYSVEAEIHVQGRGQLEPDLVDNTDGIVVAIQRRDGSWNGQFEGPESLDGEQQQACIQAVMDHLAAESTPASGPALAGSPAPVRRSRAAPKTK